MSMLAILTARKSTPMNIPCPQHTDVVFSDITGEAATIGAGGTTIRAADRRKPGYRGDGSTILKGSGEAGRPDPRSLIYSRWARVDGVRFGGFSCWFGWFSPEVM